MTQTLAAVPYAHNAGHSLLPLFELVEPTYSDKIDFTPPGKGTEAAVPDFSLTDVEGHKETIDWFRNLVAMAEGSLKGTGRSIFVAAE